jgi:ABC-2 type transport system permease protein
LTLGYVANADSSRSIFTLLNLFFLFGAFSFPSTGILGLIRECVPTYQLYILSYWGVDHSVSLLAPLICLSVYILLFLYLFQKVYRKTC